MAEYIEREAALRFQDELEPVICKSVETGALFSATKDVDLTSYLYALPAADVRPVVRGKWVAEKEDVEWGCSTVRYRCSHCGRLPHFDKESFKFLLSDFCPKCGADMRGGEPHE